MPSTWPPKWTENSVRWLRCSIYINYFHWQCQYHTRHWSEWRMIYVAIDLYLQVQACGSLVTEEQPHAMLLPLEYFLVGYGLYRPSRPSCSPRSPLSPSCISPELLSPESMGVKLKPIKTRITLEVWTKAEGIYDVWLGEASPNLHDRYCENCRISVCNFDSRFVFGGLQCGSGHCSIDE